MEKRYTLDIPEDLGIEFFENIKKKYNPISVILPSTLIVDIEDVKAVLNCPVSGYYGKYCVVICEE